MKMQNNEPIRNEIPQIMEISRVVSEGKGQKSFFFKENIHSKPGQFIMLWIPDVDEKPMAISYYNKNEFAITSQVVGKFTKALDLMKKGGKVGIRGPYGNGFSIGQNACVVGGGVGMASVSTLIDTLKNPIIINGARSKEHLIYLKRYKKMLIATDDGSFGKKGYTTDVLNELLINNKKNKIRIVYACGPEIMMKKILEICNKYKVDCEASLERMMKCGFGICGACMCNDKIVCMDGPVFNLKQLNNMPEFGNFARAKTGKRVSLHEYHAMHI
ncbi:dihydroorotate dehydrogenase electron transfer subunit [Candidatus Woesearchaeota archaeon]|nr:dihydroorotate dehydrogenase electron transfer subunit [Candidatus Woesearchaeota archaeon]